MHRLLLFTLFLLMLGCHSEQQPRSLHLLFVGDMMSHASQIAGAKQWDGSYDYAASFNYVAPIISEADLAIGNLELTLSDQPPFSGYPKFCSPAALASALKEAGFDVLMMANNHMNDKGAEGLAETGRILDRLGFARTGAFCDSIIRSEKHPLLIEREGFRLAFLNYTYGTESPTEPPTLVNVIDMDQMRKDLFAAAKKRPDAVIVFLHWGVEYEREENEEQKALADKLFSWGADMVIGAGPHVVQPVKVLEQNGDRKLAAYSLGNFISNQQYPHTDGGLMLEVDLVKTPGVMGAHLGTVTRRFVWRFVDSKQNGTRLHQIIPIVEAEKGLLEGLQLYPSSWSNMHAYAQAEEGR